MTLLCRCVVCYVVFSRPDDLPPHIPATHCDRCERDLVLEATLTASALRLRTREALREVYCRGFETIEHPALCGGNVS